ncbi:DUF4261 domain-containing protein [Mucilaginibacter sp. CAU 1740]|uniref:DUF4261 domain-containing protein n=1 Tax=Mucilaginibacter sp. CAU 1740 TaxID=3140365 RepID=UPI00325C325E
MNFLKKLSKKPKPSQDPRISLAMVMLPEPGSFSLQRFITDISKNHTISEADGDDAAAAFKFDDDQFYIATMPGPIPHEDIENTAQYAYNWPTAVQDLERHHAHIIVALSSTNNNFIKHFKLITHVVSSILKTTDAIGVYIGDQSLLIPKNDYLVEAAAMDDSLLPLNLWIYIGLRTIDDQHSGYTYGLKAFGLNEIEVIDSSAPLTRIRELLYNVSHYVISNNIKLNAGETVGGSEDEKIEVGFSKAVFVEGDSYKLTF